MKKEPTLLFINHYFPLGFEAHLTNFLLRKKALIASGMKVKTHNFMGGKINFIKEMISLFKILPNVDILYVELDGTGILEKFSLLKLLKPKLFLIWEIHASLEEAYWFENSQKIKIAVFIRNVKRKLLAKLVNATICVSYEMENYTQKVLKINRNYVIPNFIDKTDFQRMSSVRNKNQQNSSIAILKNPNFFKVLWGGGANYPWQGLDIIEKVAKKIYYLDKKIVFLIFGSYKWHKFTFTKNIILLDSVPYKQFLHNISCADICLALYKNPKTHRVKDNFYFSPMKIFDYLMLAKPVIASRLGQIKQIITHGKNGFLTNNSTDDIIRKILLLKRNPLMAAKMGKAGKTTVLRKFELKTATRQYKQAFKSMGIL